MGVDGAVTGHARVPPGGVPGMGEAALAADGDDVGVGDDERESARRRALENRSHAFDGNVLGTLGAFGVGCSRAVDGLGAVREHEVRLVDVDDGAKVGTAVEDGAAGGPREMYASVAEGGEGGVEAFVRRGVAGKTGDGVLVPCPRRTCGG